MMDAKDFSRLMEPVARQLLGPPNERLSTAGKELRWGSHGSVSVDLAKGTWFDHANAAGGGVLDLIERQTGARDGERVEWLRDNGYVDSERAPAAARKQASSGKIVATYDYVDVRGQLVFQVCRLEPKTFRQRRKVDGKWEWSVKGVQQVPYRLPDVAEAIADGQLVIVVEGEKDADALAAWGIAATCNAGGAGKWPDEIAKHFEGADVVILPDNDDAGRKHCSLVGAALKHVAKRVRVLDLPNLPPKGDVSDWIEAGGDVAQFFKLIDMHARAWSVGMPISKFGAVRWCDMDLPGPEHDWLIKDILTRGERSLCVGPSGSGKSFLAQDMALSVARGVTYCGKKVKRGLVIYQAGEGGRGMKKRLRAYRKAHNIPHDADLPFVLLPSPVDLYASDDDTDALIAEIKAWAALYDVPLELVVIDTLSAATPGANENASEDMTKVLARLARVAAETNSHVMLVHHLNAAGSRPRGHSSLFANIENAIEVTKADKLVPGTTEDGREIARALRLAKVTKQKDEAGDFSWGFVLRRITLGHDADNDPITSCVCDVVQGGDVKAIEASDTAKEAAPQQTGFKLTDNEAIFFRALMDAIGSDGVATPADVAAPASVGTVVDYKHVKRRVAAKMLLDEDDTAEGQKKHRERVKAALRRARETLTRYGVIGADDPWIWWTGKPVRGFAETQPKKVAPPAEAAPLLAPGETEIDWGIA